VDLDALHFLQSDEGQHRLATLAETAVTPDTHLALATSLRQELPAEWVHALLETILLRQKARTKFSRASQMYFTRAALEQASAEVISRYRARRFAHIDGAIVDLGCGIGGDALSLTTVAPVFAVDHDLLRLAMARANAGAYGRGDRLLPVQADLLTLPPWRAGAFFADPGRRDERGHRAFSVHAYRPPLAALLQRWLPAVPAGAVKVSPAVDFAEIPQDVEVEIISVEGEVREALLWFGALRSGVSRRATLLPAGDSLSAADDDGHPVPVTAPQSFLYEPDGAIIRAHLVQSLARQLGAHQIDESIAYLTSDHPQPTPFARCFALEAAMPFHLKRLRKWLRAHDVGRVVVKKRGSPLDPDTFPRRLRLSGDREVILFLTHVMGAPYVLVGSEWAGNN
jgi:hypothetical protein